ncbi:hypothetical protein [Actinomadura nitritigenes]|uniref:hypothetical protein n=1 Tax=Actinomadura nitritigenes TaxID=134602 RepID=UPI003D931D57
MTAGRYRHREIKAGDLSTGTRIRRLGADLEVTLAIPWDVHRPGGPRVFVVWRELGSEDFPRYGDGVFTCDTPFRLIGRPNRRRRNRTGVNE